MGYQGYPQGQQSGAGASGPGQFGATSFTPNAQGTLNPNVSPADLAGSFNPGSFGGGYGPQNQFGQQVGPGPSVDPNLKAFQDLFNSSVMNPALQQYGYTKDDLQKQMALATAGGEYQVQQQQQNAGFSLENLGFQRQQLGIQQGALARQMALLPQEYSLQTQGFDLTQAQNNYGAMEQMRNLNSGATASGSFTSAGTNAGRGDINQQLQFENQGLGLQRQGAALTFQEQQAQQKDSQAQLGIMSGQLGLSEKEIKSRLDNAINQIGIGTETSSDAILAKLHQAQTGTEGAIGGAYFQDLLQFANLQSPPTG